MAISPRWAVSRAGVKSYFPGDPSKTSKSFRSAESGYWTAHNRVCHWPLSQLVLVAVGEEEGSCAASSHGQGLTSCVAVPSTSLLSACFLSYPPHDSSCILPQKCFESTLYSLCVWYSMALCQWPTLTPSTRPPQLLSTLCSPTQEERFAYSRTLSEFPFSAKLSPTFRDT